MKTLKDAVKHLEIRKAQIEKRIALYTKALSQSDTLEEMEFNEKALEENKTINFELMALLIALKGA